MTYGSLLLILCVSQTALAQSTESRPARNRDRSSPPRSATRPAKPADKKDYTKHIAALKKRLPRGFHIVLQPPFVVVGNEAPAKVRARAKHTVKWAVDLLKKAYFAKDPKEIIDVWLFKNDASYRRYTKELFGDRPTTPFGYYSPQHDALIMNIATGGGTLVHEIVHPFVRANFPNCPSWFNEGLGSLYEQCHEKDGKIVGLTNWRLRGLQKAIRKKQLPSFRVLLGTSDRAFYDGEHAATNYAQARYLCYYLQHKGLLRKFYRQFHANRREDSGGYETLKGVLGVKDMAAFQDAWQKWVMKLRFGR